MCFSRSDITPSPVCRTNPGQAASPPTGGSSGDGCGSFNHSFQKEREGGVSLSRRLGRPRYRRKKDPHFDLASPKLETSLRRAAFTLAESGKCFFSAGSMTTRLAPSEYLRTYLLGLALEKSYSFLISVVAALAFLPFFILVPFALAGLTSADDSNCIVFLCKDNHQKPGFLRHSHDQESCFRCRVVWIVDDSAQTVAKHGCSFEERNVLLLQIAVSFVGVPLEPESHVVSVPPCLRSSVSPTGYLPRLPNDQASAARRCL